MIHSLVYVSDAVVEFDAKTLHRLALRAASVNVQNGVTGYLHFKNGVFFQYLEGDEPHVTGIFDRITGDPRHAVVNTIILETRAKRLFSEWSMRHVRHDELVAIGIGDLIEGVVRSMKPMPDGLGLGEMNKSSRAMANRLCEKIAMTLLCDDLDP